MVVEAPSAGSRQPGAASVWVVALAAVLPLVVPGVWSGFRLAQSDPVLSVISELEQPLSVRSPGGLWAIALVLAWFSLTYAHRRVTVWEAALVLLGGGLALARLGNSWADAALILLPLARQLKTASFKAPVLTILAALCLVMAVLTLADSRPPPLPQAVAETVAASGGRGSILADWRWASDLQRRVGADRVVLASGGVASESSDFWLEYVRIARGHEQWASALTRLDVDLVVLESLDQQRLAADLVRASADWQILYDAHNGLVAARVRG